jgi:cytochrome c oxidase subunit 2
MKHFVAVIILIAIVTVALANGLNSIQLLPTRASAEGLPIDWLFGLHIQVIAFLFALIMVFMIYSALVFRRKKGDNEDGAFFHGNATLEIVWTVVPLVVVLYFAYLGAVTLNDITSPGQDELVVEVTASQWSWRFDYPDLGLSSTELNLPLGRTTHFKVTSTDVIHSFWVPEFRVKQDTVPGMVKSIRVTPTQLGNYKIRCAELCGLDHTTMLANVNVMMPSEFENWVNEENEELAAAEGGSGAERGQQVAELAGCTSCHSVDGSEGNGPTWLGLYGREETLDDGSTVVVDDDYLHRSIVEPGAQITAGFANIMPPTYGETLSEEEIGLLVEYIESLGQEQ